MGDNQDEAEGATLEELGQNFDQSGRLYCDEPEMAVDPQRLSSQGANGSAGCSKLAD